MLISDWNSDLCSSDLCASEELEQTRRLFHHKQRRGPFAQGSVEQQDARRRIEIPQAQGWTPMNIVRLERWKTVGIGKRPQSAVVRLVHARTSAGTLSGNQRRPNQKAALTSRISTGTSTSGPITAAKATGEASPKAAMATAIASSKLLPAAVNATAVVRG